MSKCWEGKRSQGEDRQKPAHIYRHYLFLINNLLRYGEQVPSRILSKNILWRAFCRSHSNNDLSLSSSEMSPVNLTVI